MTGSTSRIVTLAPGVAVAEPDDAVLGDGGGDHAGAVGGGGVQGRGEGGERGGDHVVVGGGVEEGVQGAARGGGLRAGAEVREGQREGGDLRRRERGRRGGRGLGVRRNVRHDSIIRSNNDILEVAAPSGRVVRRTAGRPGHMIGFTLEKAASHGEN
ncbi:hypothetical protein [Actinomadura madurae]|uniref:hypothetical protein n=1 Tax=Actinomadura madurae TaxID=1993 RepID=UPI0020D20BB3|nr:hypothetical protein [Actinomadura madurae]MCQ0004761.1 hypothetical protein [Actinomadura madurae]